MRRWNNAIGEKGDLADIVVAIIALAETQGRVKVRLDDYYRVFVLLSESFPSLFPVIDKEKAGDYIYSKALGNALQGALGIGLQIANPMFQYLQIPEGQCTQVLTRLERRTGPRFVSRLRPVAIKFNKLVAAESQTEC